MAPSAATARAPAARAALPAWGAPKTRPQTKPPSAAGRAAGRQESTAAAKDFEGAGQAFAPDAAPASGEAESAGTESDSEQQERAVAVEGIEGTMSEYDVRATLENRAGEFDRCHDRGRGGSGRINFRIRILASGDVSDVKVRSSKVRSREIVSCYTDVVEASKFPSPHGGYADVTWSTKVGRSRPRPTDMFERRVRWDAPSETEQSAQSSRSGRRHRRH